MRPIVPGDRDALARGFDRLGPESRYRRFLSPVDRLTGSQLTYLTDVDHDFHEALVAVRDGEIVGVARYIREEPGADRAEVAVTVVDEWQGRGIGRLLLDRLSERARADGIAVFTATVLGTNHAVIDLLGGLGDTTTDPAGNGQLALEIELEGDTLPLLLRHAATGVVDFLARRLAAPG